MFVLWNLEVHLKENQRKFPFWYPTSWKTMSISEKMRKDGWPLGRPRMARGKGGGDVPQYIKMAARAASFRLSADRPWRSSTDGPQVVRGWPNRCAYRR